MALTNNLKKLVNPQATSEAKALMSYLVDNYGKKIISGQQEAPSANPNEMEHIEEVTGKLPAIRCLDYLHYSPSIGNRDGVTERALEWANEKKGIVSICWHWFAPCDGASFYTKDTSFDITKAITPGTEEYDLILRDMDVIATELKILQEANIPVLWRPLHEADGAWFWWGAKGAEPCKKLYWLMYDYFTNHHKLHNLIWVWTFATNDVAYDWYPGDEYVDIVGIDKYFGDRDYNPNIEGFNNLLYHFENKKLIAMPENGPIPDPDELIAAKAKWSWFCPWWGGFITSDKWNDLDHVKKVYNHPYVVTLDQLPDLKNYK